MCRVLTVTGTLYWPIIKPVEVIELVLYISMRHVCRHYVQQGNNHRVTEYFYFIRSTTGVIVRYERCKNKKRNNKFTHEIMIFENSKT